MVGRAPLGTREDYIEAVLSKVPLMFGLNIVIGSFEGGASEEGEERKVRPRVKARHQI